jgi:hypothetical protein
LPTTRSLSTTPVDMGGQYSKDKSIAGRDHDHWTVDDRPLRVKD